MSNTSAAFRLADLLLQPEGGVVAYVKSRREAGVSWRRISLDLRDRTNLQVDVEPSTLRNWFVALPTTTDDEPEARTG